MPAPQELPQQIPALQAKARMQTGQDTGTPGTSREIYSEDADCETQTRNPSVMN